MTGDRTMNIPRFKSLAATLVLALGLGACGGGATDLAGIGGTGITATGQITGFGSIFVNGVEYFIQDGATIKINGKDVQESALKLGMIVTLSGTLNADGITGTVNNVIYESELKGPVTAIDPNGPDPDNKIKTLVILGKTVIVDAISTSFGDDTGAANNYSFAAITVNDVVEVSGYITDGNGTLQATRIEKKGEYIPGGNTVVTVKGTVTAFAPAPANSFTLDGVLTVNFDPATTYMQGLVDGFNDGSAVEVEGTFTNDATTIFATKIQSDDSGLPDDVEQAEIEGLITDYISPSNFKVNGQQVNAANAQLLPSSATLADGVFVKVEGPIVSGTLKATRVEVRNSNIEIEAYVSGNPTNNTVSLRITNSGFIDIVVDSNQTQMEDNESGEPITFATISDGDFLKVEAYKNSNGDIIATQIKRLTTAESEIVLKAPIDSWTLTGGNLSVTLMEITFSSDSGTDFEHNDQPLADAAAMYSRLQSLGSGAIFRVDDDLSGSTYSDGIVSEMEVES